MLTVSSFLGAKNKKSRHAVSALLMFVLYGRYYQPTDISMSTKIGRIIPITKRDIAANFNVLAGWFLIALAKLTIPKAKLTNEKKSANAVNDSSGYKNAEYEYKLKYPQPIERIENNTVKTELIA
jgi:hypothetical protein